MQRGEKEEAEAAVHGELLIRHAQELKTNNSLLDLKEKGKRGIRDEYWAI